MRIDFRQGIVSYQAGGFLNINGGGHVDVLAAVKPTTVSVAHKHTNYLHSEDNTINSAWSGPFLASTNYWLYWLFNPLTFSRSFKYTTLEPVSQSVEPGAGNAAIINVIPGLNGNGAFVVDGHYIQKNGKTLAVVNSTANDGNYVVDHSEYNSGNGETTIYVNEDVIDTTIDGELTIDVDYLNIPLRTEGRMWYNTTNNTHYILEGNVWVEILAVFAALLTNGNTFVSVSINGGSDFTGTQIGDTSSVLAGRVLFSETSDPITRDDGTFFTTEDQFFSTASRVDGIRIESNVTRAQFNENIAVAAFTPVSFDSEGKIKVGQYDDTGTTVIGMLMEDLLSQEVGAVVLQGVITNPDWNWDTVGMPLWVDNGTLTPNDPHVNDAINFPHSQVPVARVLKSDTIIFEQGLGGVGEQGPAGSIDNLPPATTTDLGAVTLVTPSSDSQRAYVITDTDPRLTDARIPLPHIHPATDISFTPGAGITSSNVQLGMEELGNSKVNTAGDNMTGFLTLHAKPVNDFHAATKNYVDELVLGLIWLEPVDLINMISDTVTVPPLTPESGDAYIIPPGATGDWAAIPAGNIAHYDSDSGTWQDLGPVTAVDPNGARFGISFTSNTTPSGSFVGQTGNIAIYDPVGNLTTFEVPNENNAIYVSNGLSSHAYNQYAFNGTNWVLMGGGNPLTVDGTTTILAGNVLSVIPASSGGQVDALTWNGTNAPSTIGTNNQILITDGAGNTSWADNTTGDGTTTILAGNVLSVIPASSGGQVDALTWNGINAPSTSGTNLQYLQTDGAGNTVWADVAGGGLTTCNVTNPVDEEILVYDSNLTCWNNQYPDFLRSTTNLARIEVFDGSGYTTDNIQITIGSTDNATGGEINIVAGDTAYVGGNGGQINLTSGAGTYSNSNGGNVNIHANYGDNTGGSVILLAGNGGQHGGQVNITSGITIDSGGSITPSGGNINIKTAGENYASYNSKTPGALILETENGNRGKYTGDEYKGRGIAIKLGASPDYNSPIDKQHLHIIPTLNNSSVSNPVGVNIHQGPDINSPGVTLVSSSLQDSFYLKMPTISPPNTGFNKMLMLVDADGLGGSINYGLLPQDKSFSKLGIINDGDIVGYHQINRNIYPYTDGNHSGQCITAPTGGDATFEFGIVQTNNTLTPIGTITFLANNTTTTTTSGFAGQILNGPGLLYIRCVTSNGISDVSIGIKCYTEIIDITT